MPRIILFVFLAFFTLCNANIEAADTFLKKAQKDSQGRFHAPWENRWEHSFLTFLRWQFSKNPYSEEKKKEVSFPVSRPDFKSLEASGKDYAVWLGHSTVFLKLGGKAFITDPVFGDINFFLKRKTPFPIGPEELPRIDFVLVSHGHYDHLNTKTITELKEAHDPYFVTGPGYEGYFKSVGITKNIALNWTEAHEDGAIKITSLPVQHWSKRGVLDTDKMLWCSFLIEAAGKKVYWVGDTGYFRGFKEIGERFGPVDVLFAPVGSYEPRWFMKRNHVNPEEALKIATDVKAKLFIPIHWGTFDLTDEPLGLPLKALKEAYDPAKDAPLKVLEHGGAHVVE